MRLRRTTRRGRERTSTARRRLPCLAVPAAVVVAVVVTATALATALGGAAPGAPGTPEHAGRHAVAPIHGSGNVDVLYAGSLVTLMQTRLAAAFHRRTGFTVTGIAAGSSALAQEIKGGVRQADVFVSASPSVNATLRGTANGGWESWYLSFATSPLLLGYDPNSHFASALRHHRWWKVVTRPGFLLGRTNPVTDPKGVLARRALDEMAARHHDPALAALGTDSSNVFPEQTMIGRLQAGQLDAGFFYKVEATSASIPTVPLSGVRSSATYTVSVLAHAPHHRGAVAFVSFLLSREGRRILAHDGLRPSRHPHLVGRRRAVPAAVRSLLRR